MRVSASTHRVCIVDYERNWDFICHKVALTKKTPTNKINEKNIVIWSKVEMEWSREGFGYDKPLWKERRGHLLQFPDHIAMEKRKLKQKISEKQKKKKGPKIRL